MFLYKRRSSYANGQKYACFDCRVCFASTHFCPHCRKATVNVGQRFKAPKRTNVKEWDILALWHYRSDRKISIGGRKPATLKEARERYSETLKDRFDHKITKNGLTHNGKYASYSPPYVTFK